MKKTILPALAMLIVAAVMLSTASYAWFAMSNTATASDMKVNIKTDSSFLMISNVKDVDAAIEAAEEAGNTLTAIDAVQGFATTRVPVLGEGETVESAALYPVAHTARPNDSQVSYDAYYATVGNWFTKTADKPDSYISSGDATPLGSFTDYVLVNSFYLAVADGTTDMENLTAKVSIKYTGNTATDGDKAIRVLVVSSNGAVEFDEGDNGVYAADVDFGDVTSTEVTKVDIYIYYDGESENIFTNGITSILDTTIEVTFMATPKTAQQ